MNTQEIKNQARHTAKLVPESQRELFLSEIDSLIDRTVQMEQERIVGEIDKTIEKVLQMSDWKAHSVLEDLKSLITNKSDINK